MCYCIMYVYPLADQLPQRPGRNLQRDRGWSPREIQAYPHPAPNDNRVWF